MFKKFIFLLAWIGIFLLSIIGINFVLLPQRFIFENSYVKSLTEFQIGIIILSVSILYIIIVLYKLISLFERKKEYKQQTENGVITISNTTVNNYVLDLLRKDNEIGNIKVTSENKGKNFYVYIKFQVLSQVNVPIKISRVQDAVKDNLTNTVGIEVKDVIVNVTGLSTKEPQKKTEEN